MSEKENVEVVKSYYGSFRQGDPWSIIPKVFTPDVEYLNFVPEEIAPETKAAIPWAGLWKGHQGVKDFQTMLLDNFEVLDFKDAVYIAEGDRVAVFGKFKFMAKSTRKVVESDIAVHVAIRDGKIAEYHFFEDTYGIASSFRHQGSWEIENNGKRRNIP